MKFMLLLGQITIIHASLWRVLSMKNPIPEWYKSRLMCHEENR